MDKKGELYFVATPIGNLNDVSVRAIETLKFVDVILCEDTRTSSKFLNFYEIKKPLESYHKFNYKTVIPNIIERLNGGTNFALITDAGMPCISDPGSEIINELQSNNIKYTIIPGACAFVSAMALSGYNAPHTFIGFLPENKKQEKKLLAEIKTYQSNLIFYCAPHKLIENIKSIYKVFDDRECCTVREITKMFEEVEYFSLKSGYKKEPKGEYVLIVKGSNSNQNDDLNSLSVIKHYEYYINLNYSKNDAIKQVAKDRNVPKNEIYQQIINIK